MCVILPGMNSKCSMVRSGGLLVRFLVMLSLYRTNGSLLASVMVVSRYFKILKIVKANGIWEWELFDECGFFFFFFVGNSTRRDNNDTTGAKERNIFG